MWLLKYVLKYYLLAKRKMLLYLLKKNKSCFNDDL